MRRYEIVYIINPDLETEPLREVIAKFSDMITKLKGYVLKVNEWGKRKLAYEVKRFDKGYYVVCDFCGDPSAVTEVERNLKLDDRVLKYITVKVADDVDPEELMRDAQQQETGAEESEAHQEAIEET
ncbi:MAG: 30S ribosomal protein S6 [Thermodesulfobacteriota bacterium]